jgi:hypothetical protein
MANLLNQQPDYVFSQNRLGATRKYLYESGMLFREFKSHLKIGALPLVHITLGVNPETGKRIWAKGVIAIGRKAAGIIAIGQLAIGVISIGQLSIALLIALGQLSIAGLFAAGQGSVGAVAIGQAAGGLVAIGQFAAGFYALGQFGTGKFVLSTHIRDPQAVNFFKSLLDGLKTLVGI